MSFKIFLIWSSGGPLVQRSRTICAILVEGIMGNIPVKLYGHLDGGAMEDCFSFSPLLATLVL